MTPFASAAGEVLFLLLAPFWLIVGGYFAAYGAHSLLVVIEQTAAGFDAVVWPEDRFLDYFWKPVYLAGLYVLWLVPVAIVAPSLAVVFGQALPRFVGGAAFAVFWLVFPVSLLSSLSGESRFLIVRWPILKGFGRCRRAALHFYAVTFALLISWGGFVYFGLVAWEEILSAALVAAWPGLKSAIEISSIMVLLPALGCVAGLVLLLYGRLLGRMAWLIQVSHPEKKTGTDENDEPRAEKGEPAEAVPAQVGAKSEVPTSATAPSMKPIYALADEPTQPPPAAPPFRWEPGRMPPAAPPRKEWRDRPDVSEPADVEPEPRADLEPVEEGKIPLLWTRRVYLFPFYRTTWKAWFWLTVGATSVALLVRLHLSYP